MYETFETFINHDLNPPLSFNNEFIKILIFGILNIPIVRGHIFKFLRIFYFLGNSDDTNIWFSNEPPPPYLTVNYLENIFFENVDLPNSTFK